MSELRAGVRNNMCAYLDASTRNAQHFAGMIEFLLRSRIYKAISTDCKAYFSHQRQFWENAVLDKEASPNVIRSSVFGIDVFVSAEHLNRVLEFGDVGGSKFILNKYLVRGCFQRVGYSGDLREGVLNKAYLSPQYKYLAHVLQHCLSSRKAGHDELRETIQGAFVALILNIPFDFSGMIFQHLVENMTTKKEKYLMYARFIQMLINVQAPDLPKSDLEVIPIESMTDITMNRLLSYKRSEKPRAKRLIGHLIDPNYVAPGGKRWRHPDSDSEVEDMPLPDSSDSDDDNDDDVVGDAPDVPSVSIPTTDAAASTPTIVQQQQGETGDDDDDDEVEDTFEFIKRTRPEEQKREKEKKKRKKFDYTPFSQKVAEREAAKRSRSEASRSTSTPPAHQPPPIFTVPPSATEASIPSSVAEQLSSMQTVLIKLLAENSAQAQEMAKHRAEMDEQKGLVQSLIEKVEEKELVIAEMSSQLEEQAELITDQASEIRALKAQASDQQKLLLDATAQLKKLQDCNDRMIVAEGGLLKYKSDSEETESDDDDNDGGDAAKSKPSTSKSVKG